jgi:hypothetical protein
LAASLQSSSRQPDVNGKGLNQFAGGWEVISPAGDRIEGRRLSCPARSTNMKPTPATRLNWRVMVTAGRPHVDVAGPLRG